MKVRAAIKHIKLKEYVCMPPAANLEKLFSAEVLLKQHPEWKIEPCPVCGQDCIDGIFKKGKEKKIMTETKKILGCSGNAEEILKSLPKRCNSCSCYRNDMSSCGKYDCPDYLNHETVCSLAVFDIDTHSASEKLSERIEKAQKALESLSSENQK